MVQDKLYIDEKDLHIFLVVTELPRNCLDEI
jgi:hypothetical protein